MRTLAVDHSREVTSVLMIQTKMAHLCRLGHRVGWFGLLTTQQHSCRDGEALFTEVGSGHIVILPSKSPFTIYIKLHSNEKIKSVKTESNKVLCGYAADYDPQLQEHREYSLCQFFLMTLFF